MERIHTAEQLQVFLYGRVPLAPAMGVRVIEASGRRVRMHFPLAPNLNHHGTAFGGSLSAAGILAGWALLHMGLSGEDLEAATVVAESRTRYREPVDTDFEATAEATGDGAWEDFIDSLRRRGRARLEIRTEIGVPGAPAAVVHDGIYVAIAK